MKDFFFVYLSGGKKKPVMIGAANARDARESLIARGYNIVSGPYQSWEDAKASASNGEAKDVWWFVISYLADEGETKTDVRSVTSEQLSKWKWAINERSARRYLESYGYTVVSGPYGSEAEARAHSAGKRAVDIAHGWTDEQIEALKKRFKSEYGKARREMRGKVKSMLAEYDEKNEEWKKLLASGKVTREEYDAWLKGQAAQRRYVQDMADMLASDARRTDELAMDAINDVIPYVYAENANRAAFDIEKGIGYDTHSFDLYDQSTVRRLMREQPELLPPIPEARLDKRKDKRWNKQKFSSAITQAILQGDSIPQASERLMRVLKMDEDSAVRAARTAITGAENAGRVDSFKRAKRIGIDLEQQWMATLDMRTRHSHRQLDGQHVPVGEKFKVDDVELEFPADPTAPPEYVYNCRCTLVAWFEGIDMEDPDRLSLLPDGMSYDDWKNQKQREMEARAAAEAAAKEANIEELRRKVADLENEVIDLARNRPQQYLTDLSYYEDSVESARADMEEYAWAASLNKAEVEAENQRLYARTDEIGEIQGRVLSLRGRENREEKARLQAQIDEWYAAIDASDRKLRAIDEYEYRKGIYDRRVQELEERRRARQAREVEIREHKERLADAMLRRNRAYGELSAAQPFAPDVRAKVGDDFAEHMERIISSAEERHPEIAKAYRRFSCKFTVLQSDRPSGAHYDPNDGGIRFNAGKDRRGESVHPPYGTVFHEFGHLMDNVSSVGRPWEWSGRDNGLMDVLKDDWKVFRSSVCKGSGLRRNADKDRRVIDTLLSEGARRKRHEYGDLSDIIEGMTGVSYPFGVGHGADYHRNNNGYTSLEFFAEVCGSAMTSEESYQQLKRVFPNGVALVERLLAEACR